MIVSCSSCARRIGVNLGSASNREEASGLQALAQTCARKRINGEQDCGAHKALQRLKPETQEEALSR